MMQFQSDILRKPIDRPKMVETTAFGAAFLAGLAVGVWKDIGDIASIRESDRVFTPEMDVTSCRAAQKWLRAVERAAKWGRIMEQVLVVERKKKLSVTYPAATTL